MNEQVTVACVLRSGGDFFPYHVSRLYSQLREHSTVPFKFRCLTDQKSIDIFMTIPLYYKYKGWWAKMELFRPSIFDTPRVVYFDLDTVIVNNIDHILTVDQDFLGLKPFNPKRQKISGYFASGVLAWRNGYPDFAYQQFRYAEHAMQYRGDQDYLTAVFAENSKPVKYLQDYVSGIYSFKRHFRKSQCEDACVVCFHGNPRPTDEHIAFLKRRYENTGRK